MGKIHTGLEYKGQKDTNSKREREGQREMSWNLETSSTEYGKSENPFTTSILLLLFDFSGEACLQVSKFSIFGLFDLV